MYAQSHEKSLSAPVAATAKRASVSVHAQPATAPAWERALNHAPLLNMPLPIQTKLTVNQPGDAFEQEADRVAERVMRMPEPRLQRGTCACGGEAGPDGECAACKAKRLALQRRATVATTPHHAPPIVHQTLQAAGQPLDSATRTFMESRFSADFDGVRVHTDAQAAQSAQAVNAYAYTVGKNVVFGAGRFAPATYEGRHLLAHELTHVMQQSGAQETSVSPHAGKRDLSPISPTPLAVARSNGDGTGKTPFQVTDADLKSLEMTVRELMNLVDPKTRAQILRNDTVAVGLVVDSDGEPTLVYTVAQNRTYPSLREAAAKLEITRWNADPSVKGRGVVGAPGDAEQIMLESAGEEFDIAAMGVTRTVCPDCRAATQAAKKGGIPIVEVKIPMPNATTLPGPGQGSTAPAPPAPANDNAVQPGAANDNAVPQAPGAANDNAVPQAPANDNAVPQAPGAANDNAVPPGAANDNAVPQAPGAANDNAVPRVPGAANDNAIPRAAVPEGPGAAAPEGAARVNIPGIVMGVVIELAIAAAIALIIGWLRGKIEQMVIEYGMKALQPKMQTELEKHAAKITELQKNGKVYARITVDVKYVYGLSTEGGVPAAWDHYDGVELVGVDVAGENSPSVQSERSERLSEGRERVHYLQAYSVLIDDPQKRARDKEQSELAEKLNRIAKQQPKSPAPQSPAPQSPPPLNPAEPKAAPSFDPLPGAPGRDPIKEASAWVQRAEAYAGQLVAEGTALLNRTQSNNSPTPLERQNFFDRKNQWRLSVMYMRNWFKDQSREEAVNEISRILEQKGGKLNEICTSLGE